MFSLKKLAISAVVLCALALFSLFILYISMKSELPNVESLKDLKWQTPMQIYSSDGKLISQFGEKKRIPLKLDDMPQKLIEAILATEDDRFYSHFGVDPIGVGRAVIAKLRGQNKGGASTITMQVARNFFLTREVTYTRKIREVFLSFHIENLLTKDEILALYMNKIELGHRAFGFGAAAQVYYGKDVKELTLAQIAVLAGLPKAPSTLNPISRPDRAKSRRSVVLQRMLVSGYITDKQYQEANTAPITGKRHGAEIELDAPYIAEMAHQEMISRLGKEEAYTGGYKVYLTVSSKLQSAAQQAVLTNLMNYDQRHGYRGPIKELRPVIENETGGEPLPANLSIAITANEIAETLSAIKDIQHLTPAVVSTVNEKSVQIVLRDNRQAEILWPGMNWAREYISDQKQGVEPKVAADILKAGDVIWVIKSQANVQNAVQTTILTTIQNTTQNNLQSPVQENRLEQYRLSQLPQASSALVSLSPDNGAIQAVVGGFSFRQSQFNRVTQAKRQVGSNIKPFIYSAALENNHTLASLVQDAPINQWDRSSGFVWRPKNSPPNYDGPIRVRLALAQSKNVVAVRLLQAVGLDKVIGHLSSFGFAPDELPHNESLALGSASLTPLEVVTGFATFANGGYLIEPYFIDRIEDSFGDVTFKATPKLACELPCDDLLTTELNAVAPLNHELNDQPNVELSTQTQSFSNVLVETTETSSLKENTSFESAERVITPQNAFLISQALNTAIWGADWSVTPGWQGTGFRARSLKRRDIAGKTGTTNEAKDAWFSGFSRRLVTTSWIGFDDPSRNLGQTRYNNNLGKNQITGKEFGAKSAQPAWIKFMAKALTDYPVEPIQPPEDIVSVRIDKTSGKLTNKTDKSSLFEYFQSGTEPIEYIKEDDSSVILDGEEEAEEIF